MPSTAPIQALPAHARTMHSPAAPSLGVPGGFGDALTQALAVPEPASSAVPAIPAATEMAAPPAQALPVLPAVVATPQAEPAMIDPGKAEKDKPAASTAETEEDKPSVKTAKPSGELQAPAPFQPTLPAPPQAAPPQAVPTVAQPVALPSEAGGADPSTAQDGSAPPVAAIDGRQSPSAAALAVAQEDKPAVEAARPSEKSQASAPYQPTLPVPPQVAQPAALPSEASDAAPSAGRDGSAAPVAGVDGHQSPPAAAQTAAPPPSAPSRAAALPEAGDTATPTAQKHSASVTAEKDLSAGLPALPAEAAPFSPVASAPLPNVAPTPLSVAPHPAPAPSQAPARSPDADKPAPPPAAAQVGPVLASFAAGAAQPGAPQHLTIRLDPTDLGRVQVRIERSPDGSARVDLKVEKPDTLLLLLRDQPQLHRALDLAGVPSTERTLQFHLAPPDATAPNAPGPGGMATPSGSDGGHGGHGQHRPGQQPSGRFATQGTVYPNDSTPGPAAFRRAGVDITA